MDSWPKGISNITLFVEDLPATKKFYQEVFGLPIHFEDPDSAVFNFGNTLINLLKVTEAPDLIGPAKVADPDGYAVELKSHRHSRCEHRRHTRRDFWLALTSRSRDGRRKNRNADAVSRERSHLLPNASPGRYLIH